MQNRIIISTNAFQFSIILNATCTNITFTTFQVYSRLDLNFSKFSYNVCLNLALSTITFGPKDYKLKYINENLFFYIFCKDVK